MTDDTATLARLREMVAEFVAEREWQKFHDPKNLSMAIAIEAAELMEHFQWTRTEDLPDVLANEELLGEVRDEISDVFCYLLALSNVLKIDLAASLEQKMKKNRAKYPAEDFRGRYFKPRD